MLLEHLGQGTMLKGFPEDQATAIAADVMTRLWHPTQDDRFPVLDTWTRSLETFAGAPGPLPKELLFDARAIRAELLDSPPETLLLHGDLHHFNVLRSDDRGWLAIDPKGVRGERAYEIVPFLLNAAPSSGEATMRRIEAFVDRLAIDRYRAVAWAFVQAVVSTCWTVEDGGEGWEGAIEFAEAVRPYLGRTA